MKAAQDVAAVVGPVPAARSLGVSRATMHRRGRPPVARRPEARGTSPRALVPAEREAALAVLHEPRFVDRAPAEIVASLLDEGRYVASERKLCRLLEAHDEVRERRDQLRHPPRAVPRLCARAPREVWSWDITPLPGPARGLWLQLYVMLDILSRYAVAWMVAPRQTGALAAEFVEDEIAIRQAALDAAFAAHPERLPRGQPIHPRPAAEVCINPPPVAAATHEAHT